MHQLFYVTVLLMATAIASPTFADEQQAIDGCIDKIREVGGPDGAGGGEVVSSDFSQAGTIVLLWDAGGTVWRCLSANDGTVEDISIGDAADDGGGAMAGSEIQAAPGGATSIVKFKSGTSSATINGTIVGREYVDYILGARAGQTLNASMRVVDTNGDGVVYFNILPPGSDNKAIFIGSMEVEPEASVRLADSGDYKIRVYLMGKDRDTQKSVGFSIDVSIR